MRTVFAALIGVALGAPALAAPAIAPECDRSCLEEVANGYLDALVSGQPNRGELNSRLRLTENAYELMVGDGLWGTASGLRDYRIYAADPETSQIGIIGVVEEGHLPAMFAMRLKVSGRKVVEVEQILARGTNEGAYADLKAPSAVMLQDVPAAMRTSRDEMQRIANAYFDGIEADSGAGLRFADDCERYENGVRLTNNPNLTSADAIGSAASLGCAAQFERGGFGYVTQIASRRFPVLDEERGLVLAISGLVHDGRNLTVRLNDGGEVPVPLFATVPGDRLTATLLRIVDGQIQAVESVAADLSYRAGTGWSAD